MVSYCPILSHNFVNLFPAVVGFASKDALTSLHLFPVGEVVITELKSGIEVLGIE